MSQRTINNILIVHGPVLNELTLTDEYMDMIRQAAPLAEIITIGGRAEWEERSGELGPKVEVAFGLRPAVWFKDMPNLIWAQQTGAGANWLLEAPEVAESDMILTNASGVAAIPIAEHILALMFVLARKIQFNVRAQTGRKWDRRGRMLELDGATLGLVGLGAIGEKTAEKAKGLNMRVLGLRRNPDRASPYVDRMYGPDGLLEVLSNSDWVAITAAMTAETEGMIGEEEFRAMKGSACIINIARGSIIREEAMIKALEEKWIAGAGLDVFEQEPLPEDSPLWEMKNVVITPHLAGSSPYYMDRLIRIFIGNLERFQAGEPLINVVDKKLGY